MLRTFRRFGLALLLFTCAQALEASRGGPEPIYQRTPSPVCCVSVQPDGGILLGGGFTHLDGFMRYGYGRLLATGAVDSVYWSQSGLEGVVAMTGTLAVNAIVWTPEGEVVIGASYLDDNGQQRGYVARLDPEGVLDSSFQFHRPEGPVRALVLQDDGYVLVGGRFSALETQPVSCLLRLDPSGVPDPLFKPVISGGGESVEAIALQPDGRILIGGRFTHVHGVPRGGIARLNADGSLDAAFDPGAGISRARHSDDGPVVLALMALPDGKILIGGNFTRVDGRVRAHVARLRPDGSLDEGFNPRDGISGAVAALAVQEDGGVLIGGWFKRVGGLERPHIARLNSTGQVDPTFDVGAGPDGPVRSIAWHGSDAVIVGGEFTAVNGWTFWGIARIGTDGDVDGYFEPGEGAFHIVTIYPSRPVDEGGNCARAMAASLAPWVLMPLALVALWRLRRRARRPGGRGAEVA
jgi:uncharacterized delta-60 repeat protein